MRFDRCDDGKRVRVEAAVATVSVGVSTVQAQQTKQNFVLANSTDIAIKSVYVSPRRSKN